MSITDKRVKLEETTQDLRWRLRDNTPGSPDVYDMLNTIGECALATAEYVLELSKSRYDEMRALETQEPIQREQFR